MDNNLDGWEYQFTFGYTSAVYEKDGKWRMVDTGTGRIIVEW